MRIAKSVLRTWFCLAAACVFSFAADVRIDVADTAPYTIPRTIFGTFLEPIGNSTYGGLWAQILENPSFEENLWSATNLKAKLDANPALYRSSEIGLPIPWQPIEWAGWRYEPRWGESANSQRSLLIMGLPGRNIGVRQAVYLPTHRVHTFTGSVYAKFVSGERVLHISLRRHDRPDDVFAKATAKIVGSDWAKYEFQLELPRGKAADREPVDFAIAVDQDSRILVDQAVLFPADNVRGLNPEMIALSKSLATPIVRFGGNYTSGYHWRDGVGPLDKRVSMLNQAWGMPEYNSFGTDEFLDFCRLIGAEPQVALNLGSGTPEEAAGWVRYVNERWNGGRGGLLWELGNELWGDWQIGYPKLEQVSERTVEFSRAVRGVDPKSRLIATGQDPDVFEKWNAEQLKAPAAFDYLATHFVVGTGEVLKRNAQPDFVAESALAYPIALEERLRKMKQQIDAVPEARDKVRLAFTEWLFYGRDDRTPRFMNHGGALITAGFLNMLIRTADFVPISDMTGLIEFGGIWQKKARVFGTPAYYAFRMYSTADIAAPVRATVAGAGTYEVIGGNRRLPEIKNVPYLDVVAARNKTGDKVTVFCVSRSLDRDIDANFTLDGFNAVPEVRVQKLVADSIYTVNDEADPERVVPVEDKIRIANGRLHYTVPRAGIVVFEFRSGETAK